MANNILQQVQTYQMSSLALLTNQNCFIGTANTKFKNFDRIEANRGDTVTFDLPPRYASNPTLTAVFQDSEQRLQTLTVDQAENVAYEFTNQEFIFNADDYMDRFGKSAIAELGAEVESNVALNALVPFRFFGDGVNPINSYGQLARALAFFRNFGAAQHETYGYLSDIAVADIVNTGLNQFVIDRNKEIANSWMLGGFSSADWCRSNLLPVHTAGTVGTSGATVPLVARPTTTSIVLGGWTASDPDAIKQNDLIEVQTDLRYLTFIGHKPSANKVQMRATANAPSDGAGNIVVPISHPIIQPVDADPTNVNLTRDIAFSADTVKVLPSHRRGLICSGKALYLAMPKLADQYPFPTGNESDPESGVSMRMYYGSIFGQNQRGFVNDVIWGSTLVPEYAMSLIFPLTQ